MKLFMFSVLLFSCVILAQPADIDPLYHTYDEVLAEVEILQSGYPSICHIETLALSTVDSLPIIAVKLSDNASEYELESVVFIVGGQHANEPHGTEVVMWLLDYLTSNYGTDPDVTKWLDSLELWFVPCDNPDGRQIVMSDHPAHTLWWRKTKRDNDENGITEFPIDGVDPNRNYDYRWDEYDSTDFESVNYKGPYPWSENASVIVRDFVDHYRPTAVFDLHSPDSCGGNKLWFSWYDPDIGNYHMESSIHYYRVAQELAENTETEVDGEYYEDLASYNERPKLENWVYWFTGTCSILMEITNQCFWHADTIDTINARVGRGFFYIFDRMLESGLVIDVFDSLTGEPIRAEIIVEAVTDTTFPTRWTAHNGRFHRFLRADNYNVSVRDYSREKVFTDVAIEAGHNTYIHVEFDRTGISETSSNNKDSALMVYFDRIICNSTIGKLEIFDIGGRKVFDTNITGNFELDAGDILPAGVYFTRLKTPDGTFCRKFISLK